MGRCNPGATSGRADGKGDTRLTAAPKHKAGEKGSGGSKKNKRNARGKHSVNRNTTQVSSKQENAIQTSQLQSVLSESSSYVESVMVQPVCPVMRTPLNSKRN